MTGKKGRSLCVAAVQVRSDNGRIQANLEHAQTFVETAVHQGAELILLPELLAAGYIFTKEIWDGAEPMKGPTVKWLRENSKRFGVYLGSSFLEADGRDFFNTFVLTTPKGDEAGRVRKQTPASFEAFFTKGDKGPHIISTAIGRIGVGICYENQLSRTPRLMCSNSVDLMLMPHSAPTPSTGFFFPKQAALGFNEILKNIASHYACRLGIPVLFSNKSGAWKSPLPGMPLFPQDSVYPGFSSVVDSDGTVKAQPGGEEGVALGCVLLDSERKTATWKGSHGRWALAVPNALNLFRIVEAVGKTWYLRSAERRKKATQISSSRPD